MKSIFGRHLIFFTIITIVGSIIIEDSNNQTCLSIIFGLFHPDVNCTELGLCPDVECNAPPESNLIWSDEFQGTALDSTKWTTVVGGGGFGDNEKQYYSEDNVIVEDGTCVIKVLKEDYQGHQYTSGRIESLATFTPCVVIQVRAKLANGFGTWPGIYLLPVNYGKGKVGIVEHPGVDQYPGETIQSVWTKKGCPGAYFLYPLDVCCTCAPFPFSKCIEHDRTSFVSSAPAVNTSNEYHCYQLEWRNDKMKFSIDGIPYFEKQKPILCNDADCWPFNADVYRIMTSVSVGGDHYGGQCPFDNWQYPPRTQIDYIKVYECTS